MKVIITGGSGFIGSNLMSFYLEQGVEVLNVDVKAPQIKDHLSNWVEVDIRDLDALSNAVLAFDPTVIIHLAARANLTGKSLEDYSTNTVGVMNLIEVAKSCPQLKRVIFTSTMLVCKAGYRPVSYRDYTPPNLYGESKMIGEEMVWDNATNLNWTIVRPTSIWGPWFGPTYRGFFDMLLKNNYFHFSGEMSTKTYGYIGNTVQQIDAIINSLETKSKVLYLGDYEPTNIKAWANEIGSLLGLKLYTVPKLLVWIAAKFGDLLKIFNIRFPMNSFRLHNMTTDNVVDLTETQLVCPNLKYSRIEGIKNTLEWMRNH